VLSWILPPLPFVEKRDLMESCKRKGAGEDRAIAHTLLLSEFDYTGNNGKKQAVLGFYAVLFTERALHRNGGP
jgi:hypothetical protein